MTIFHHFSQFSNSVKKCSKIPVPPFLTFLRGLSAYKVPKCGLLGGVPLDHLLLSFNEISARSPKWRYYKGLQGGIFRGPLGGPKMTPRGAIFGPLRLQEGSLRIPHWIRVFGGLIKTILSKACFTNMVL